MHCFWLATSMHANFQINSFSLTKLKERCIACPLNPDNDTHTRFPGKQNKFFIGIKEFLIVIFWCGNMLNAQLTKYLRS